MEFYSIVILVQAFSSALLNLGAVLEAFKKASLRLLGQAAGASSTVLWLDTAQFQLLTLFDFFVCLYFTATQTTTLLIYGSALAGWQ